MMERNHKRNISQAIQRLLTLTGERGFIHAENEQFIVNFQLDCSYGFRLLLLSIEMILRM